MKAAKFVALIVGLLGLLATPPLPGADRAVAGERYTLDFNPTHNWPGASGTMMINVTRDGSEVHFSVRDAAPRMVYTIWIVFNNLVWPYEPTGESVPSTPATRRMAATSIDGSVSYGAFPAEGNGVAPMARLSAAFTDGMGLDPGATFVTDTMGNGQVTVKLDYDIVREAPVGNWDIIRQCAPNPGTVVVGTLVCPGGSKSLRITTTWLRTFIGAYPLAERAAACANYDPVADPQSPQYDEELATGQNSLLWQCIHPATADRRTGAGLPRVPRYVWDHFRLAAHPDDLTHGFIGGNGTDHRIDMIGRYIDLQPQ